MSSAKELLFGNTMKAMSLSTLELQRGKFSLNTFGLL